MGQDNPWVSDHRHKIEDFELNLIDAATLAIDRVNHLVTMGGSWTHYLNEGTTSLYLTGAIKCRGEASSFGTGSAPELGRTLTIDGTLNAYNNYAVGLDIHPLISAVQNGDELWGLWVEPTFNDAGHSNVKHGGIHNVLALEQMDIATFYSDLIFSGGGALRLAGAGGAYYRQIIGPALFEDNIIISSVTPLKLTTYDYNESTHVGTSLRFNALNTTGDSVFLVQACKTGNTALTDLILQPYGGNLGIGTSSPKSKLAVVGLPTSLAGLSTGDIWVDTTGGLNILKIV